MKHSHNSGGATQPKTGDQLTPLKRGKGYAETMSAMASKTASGHKHVDKHYQYESAGDGQAGNCHGYAPE